MADADACACCFDDLAATGEDANVVEYRAGEDGPWRRCRYCESCLGIIMDSKFETYMNAIVKADCAAELRRLLAKGPPTYIADQEALPVDDPKTQHVTHLRFTSSGEVKPALVKDALQGEAHAALWQKLRDEHASRLEDLPEQAPA